MATLWQERRAANAHDPGYSLSVSAPTNRDAQAIGAPIREQRLAAGELRINVALICAHWSDILRVVGTVGRTLLTLDWIDDPELRRAAGQELNKGREPQQPSGLGSA